MRYGVGPILACALCAILPGVVASADGGPAGYESDLDTEHDTFHVQPPALDPSKAKPVVERIESEVNGITIIDVLLASGYDAAGEDRGNEPSIAVNPLDPNQIVLTSFSGSNWLSGGNSTLFYSSNGGSSWSLLTVVPPPPGTSRIKNCPCDQTVDWGRDGQLYATFLDVDTGKNSVYSAQTPPPYSNWAWVYRTNANVAQTTNQFGQTVDQPWLSSGPVSETQPETNVCVAYANFSSNLTTSDTRVADSPAVDPLDFVRDQPTNSDGQQPNDLMNPGHRVAVGPTGVMFDLYQRFVADAGSGVKQLTYLITASSDGGATWAVANSDHPSGAKIVAANVLSFQGKGSKVGGVNALLGGVTAISVDPATGMAWVVYGTRATVAAHDNLYLVPVTYSAGSLIVGTARRISPAPIDSYLPSVAVLPNGEVGVLFMLYNSFTSTFFWTFEQTINGGATFAKTTGLAGFSSPFPDDGGSTQRILGDYVQVKAVGCEFYGAFPATGEGTNDAASIVPYFMRAPAATTCVPPTLTGLSRTEACVGEAPFLLTLQGTGFLRGATVEARSHVGSGDEVARTTSYVSDTQVTTMFEASFLLYADFINFRILNPAPAGGSTELRTFVVDEPAASPGNALRLSKGQLNLILTWNTPPFARRYNVKRCTASSGPCTPVTVATVEYPNTSFSEPTQQDANTYWYLIESANACGAVP